MYQQKLAEIEEWLQVAEDEEAIKNALDIIIKIKTIMAMDVSAELIRESRNILKK